MTTTDASSAADTHETVHATADPAAKRVAFPTFPDTEFGPLGHLAAERARLAALEFEHFTVRRVGATLGAELHGIDLTKQLTDGQFDDLRNALHAFKVIFFREQALTPADHVSSAKRFGELEVHPFIPGNTGQS